MSNSKESFVADVTAFMRAADLTTSVYNARQTALYTGLQLEEMAEKLEAIFGFGIHPITSHIRGLSKQFRDGIHDRMVRMSDRHELLDADIDLAWVTVGSAISQGADVLGAMGEVARANLAKIGPSGKMEKDKGGKVLKPAGWVGPNLAQFVIMG